MCQIGKIPDNNVRNVWEIELLLLLLGFSSFLLPVDWELSTATNAYRVEAKGALFTCKVQILSSLARSSYWAWEVVKSQKEGWLEVRKGDYHERGHCLSKQSLASHHGKWWKAFSQWPVVHSLMHVFQGPSDWHQMWVALSLEASAVGVKLTRLADGIHLGNKDMYKF